MTQTIRYLFLASILSLDLGHAFSQTHDWDWAVSMGAAGYDYCYTLATDHEGNVYATGYYQGVVDFDPGPWEFNMSSQWPTAIYLLKLDNQGNLVWARSIKGPAYKAGYGVVLDAFGNIYLTGIFEGYLDFDPDGDGYILTSAGAHDVYVAKFTVDGDFSWARSLGGPESDSGLSIALGAMGTGDIFLSGRFSGTADFDPDTTVEELTASGISDVFVTRLDTSGALVWARSFGGTERVFHREMTIDPINDDLYIVGYFEGSADMDPDPNEELIMTSAGGYDMYISKLNELGEMIWSKQIGGTGFDKAMAIAIDTSGTNAIYITGVFQGTVDFDPGAGTTDLISAGDFDLFVARMNSEGDLEWAKRSGGTSYEYGLAIVADPLGSGRVHTVGYFSGTPDFDPDPDATFTMTSVGNTDNFILTLDGSGNFLSALANGGYAPDMILAITAGPSGALFVGGSFFSPEINFGNTTLVNAIDFSSTGDIFIVKLVALDTSVDEDAQARSISIYPNPVSDVLQISSDVDLSRAAVEVVDAFGRSVLTTRADHVIGVSHLNSGMYLVRILLDERIVHTGRIIRK